MQSVTYVVATEMLWGRSRSFFKFGSNRRRSSLSQTTIRIAARCNSALLLAEQ